MHIVEPCSAVYQAYMRLQSDTEGRSHLWGLYTEEVMGMDLKWQNGRAGELWNHTHCQRQRPEGCQLRLCTTDTVDPRLGARLFTDCVDGQAVLYMWRHRTACVCNNHTNTHVTWRLWMRCMVYYRANLLVVILKARAIARDPRRCLWGRDE
jgi:hypothetical protein